MVEENNPEPRPSPLISALVHAQDTRIAELKLREYSVAVHYGTRINREKQIRLVHVNASGPRISDKTHKYPAVEWRCGDFCPRFFAFRDMLYSRLFLDPETWLCPGRNDKQFLFNCSGDVVRWCVKIRGF